MPTDNLSDDEMSVLTEVYIACSDVKGETKCEDICMTITGGPTSEQLFNKDLQTAHANLSNINPRHPKPKTFLVAKEREALMNRAKNRASFSVQPADVVAFTKMSKFEFPRKNFKVLRGGDSSLSQWEVPVPPYKAFPVVKVDNVLSLWLIPSLLSYYQRHRHCHVTASQGIY